jgi:adenylate kinase family enzyme
MRIVICGWPASGKSRLADELASKFGIQTVYHTDSLVRTHQWSEASEAASFWFDEPGSWIIEGVAVPRALRKWIARHPDDDPPFDQFIIMPVPDDKQQAEMKPGQITMGKGHDTVLRGLEEWLGPWL